MLHIHSLLLSLSRQQLTFALLIINRKKKTPKNLLCESKNFPISISLTTHKQHHVLHISSFLCC